MAEFHLSNEVKLSVPTKVLIIQKRSPGLDGSVRRRIMYLDTTASDTLIPSFNNSPWIHGAPHKGLASHMRRIKARIFGSIGGRPRFRHLRIQWRRNPSLCQRITISGLTICNASRHWGQSLDTSVQNDRSACVICARTPFSLQDRQLLTQQQVFEGEVAPRLKQKNERIEKN